jgi:hypothetical protein
VELTGDGIVLQTFAEAILQGSRPHATMQDAVRTMELYEAIHRALQTQTEGVIFSGG